MDLALAIQEILEEIVFRLSRKAKELTGCDNLVLAGGVALNSVANGKLLRSDLFKEIWIQPAAGDAGGAIGAALAAWHIWKGKKRIPVSGPDAMKGSFLGPAFSDVQHNSMQTLWITLIVSGNSCMVPEPHCATIFSQHSILTI